MQPFLTIVKPEVRECKERVGKCTGEADVVSCFSSSSVSLLLFNCQELRLPERMELG